MIHTVSYAPQEQPRDDLEQKHLHFSLSLHLNLGPRLHRARHIPVARVTTIFAAFMGALSLVLGPFWTQAQGDSPRPTLETLFDLAGHLVVAGTLLGVGAVLFGGVPFVVSAWRTSPRSRFLLLVPVLVSLLTIACAVLAVLMISLGFPRPPLILPAFLFYGGTVVSTIAIIHAVYQAKIADKWLRLANHLSWLVVGGMVLMLIGVVLWGVALALAVPGWFVLRIPWLPPFALSMFLAVLVALWASFWQVPASQPYDASPSEDDSSLEPRGDRD